MARKTVLQRDLFSPPKRLAKLTPTEAQEQAALIAWFDWRYPALCGRLLHIPNGGYRHKAVARFLKAQGVRPGVLDLLLPLARRGYPGLWIELKRSGNGMSDAQRDWFAFLAGQGYLTVEATGFDAAQWTLEWYLSQC